VSTLFSNQWYRIAKLKPRLRQNVTSSRHHYRGVVWYVMSAASSDTTLRLDATAFHVLSQFDGKRTVDEVWLGLLPELGDQAPSQEEVVVLLSQLFEASQIDFQQQTDVEQLFENVRGQKRQDSLSRYWNPLFMRFSLFDPDRLTQRCITSLRWLFSPVAFVLWLLLMVLGTGIAAYQFDSIRAALNPDLLSPANLLVFWLVFPVMKLIHEFAHALAVKRWGGEVHECGIALLILMPVPFVDASESARFSCKYRRMAVAGAGIIAETTLAVLALMLWINIEVGLTRDIAFNVFVTGSLSSLLFNGNPLLKFDAYYVLSDMLEIPNLASRSTQYLKYLARRYLLAVRADSPVTARGEKPWFVLYGICAFLYRIALTVSICLFLAGKYFVIGMLLALWSVGTQILRPLFAGARFLLTDPAVSAARGRAWPAALGAVTVVAGVVFGVPVADATHARGVIWPVDDAMVRAEADCLIEEVVPVNGERVVEGVPLIRCETSLAEARVRNFEADYLAARAALFATRDRSERAALESEVDTAERLLAGARQQRGNTTLAARASGQFFAHDADNLVGRYFAQGEIIGYVLEPGRTTIRTMVSQDRASLIGPEDVDVELSTITNTGDRYRSSIVRRVPAATRTVVSPALATTGGGDLAVTKTDGGGTELQHAAFEIEVDLPPELRNSPIGSAVEIRFEHDSRSLAELMARKFRLLFLRRYDV